MVYPTDTAFGIGCRIDDPAAVDRLFELRRRPPQKAMPVLVASEDMALTYFDSPSDIVRHLMTKHWPGALTIVAPCKKNLVYSPIRGNGPTVGLRMPDHAVALSLIAGVGVPILGSSANFHGDPTPYRLEDLNRELIVLTDGVVGGECTTKQASTVVDTTKTPPVIIRQGAVFL